MKLYRRKLAVPKRSEGEYQRSYMSTSELAARLNRREKSIHKAAHRKRWKNIPQPEGALGTGIYYWRREKAEAWLAQAEAASEQP